MRRRFSTAALSMAAVLGVVSACQVAEGGANSDGQDGGPPSPTNDAGYRDETVGQTCIEGPQCGSGVCGPDQRCLTATNFDGIKNSDETDVDCGGMMAPACDVSKRCAAPTDCASQVCIDAVCLAASPTDGVRNGDETDVDCGGDVARACENGKACGKASDCAERVCRDGACTVPRPTDGEKNGTETDVDCGGSEAAPCRPARMCVLARDCDSEVCTGGVCQTPTATDNVKNGGETDIDCGGATAPKCATDGRCLADRDCASDGCGSDGRCAAGRSCTQRNGGTSCGRGEVGAGDAVHESCCTEIRINRPAASGGAYFLDKYLVTAGRMRQFVERVNGNARDAVKNDPKWNPAWTTYLPTNMTEALGQLGPVAQAWEWPPPDTAGYPRTTWAARGCQVNGGGARTYWQPEVGGDANRYTQDVLDQKPVNCIMLPMLLAFCIWDGKDLPRDTELTYAWTGGVATRDYPWGNTPVPPTTSFQTSNQYLVHKYGYMYPTYIAPDATFHLGAPGRKYLGVGPFGHLDLAGNVFEMARSAANVPRRLTSGSWENHVPGTRGATSGQELLRRYYAIGGRCGRR